MRGAPLPLLAASCAALVVGCYQSHELSLCTFVPVEERCQGQPPGASLPVHEFHATMHWPTAGECVGVVLAPELEALRPALQRAVDDLNALECSLLCFETVSSGAPERRARTVEVVPTCDDCCAGCAGTSGWSVFGDLCRGDIERATIWMGPRDLVDAAYLRQQLIGTMGLNVPITDAPLSLTPDVEHSLCAMYGAPPYCGD